MLLLITLYLVVANNVNMSLLKATVEFLWWGGMQSHFRVQPNYSVEFVLHYVVVGVVTKNLSMIGLLPHRNLPSSVLL